jgi:4-hydroxy-L-threonine phosphate dehydrogenase PdxA
VKLLAGRAASALSIGTDVLFSSVGHGSGFDIAGRGCADPEPLLRTIRLLSLYAGTRVRVEGRTS